MAIYEERIYEIQAGRMKEYLERYRQLGYEVQTRHLGRPLGYFVSEIGDLNLVIQLRRYDSLADRALRRAKMEADPAWIRYREANSLQVNQKNRILLAQDFCLLYDQQGDDAE